MILRPENLSAMCLFYIRWNLSAYAFSIKFYINIYVVSFKIIGRILTSILSSSLNKNRIKSCSVWGKKTKGK